MSSTLIYGPPGIGKSTLGAELSRRGNITHIDIDKVFVGENGDISQYVLSNGIEEFRKREGEILRKYLYGGDVIILGGGTLLLPANQEIANQSGGLMTLMADVGTIIARITNDKKNHRPLAQSVEDIERLYKDRYIHYTSQRVVVHIDPTESISTIASKIEQLMIR